MFFFYAQIPKGNMSHKEVSRQGGKQCTSDREKSTAVQSCRKNMESNADVISIVKICYKINYLEKMY